MVVTSPAPAEPQPTPAEEPVIPQPAYEKKRYEPISDRPSS
jgi:hypothetical protein